ncbi:MAG: autotransporter outer membrane beta-barrel domain-containing protein [Clostridia bacterium]|nr:autotransporter outer membrane beta-barrel domain-containing protein [Clostridia bacterium]
MKKLILLIMLVLPTFVVMAQMADTAARLPEGRISFITSGNVYVRFASTAGLQPGDTLFLLQEKKLLPVLVINNLSSISAACLPLPDAPELVTDMVVHASKPMASTQRPVAAQPEVKDTTIAIPVTVAKVDKSTSPTAPPETELTGRVSVSSYSNFSSEAGNSQRMRYTLSLGAKHIGGTSLSAESYISFVHTNKNWDDIKANIFDGLKIYNLALKYEPDSTWQIWLGRHINPHLTNIGAVDGLQAAKRLGAFTVGAVAGFRPDYRDYSFNGHLFQAGAYAAHQYNGKNGPMQSSLAFIEQTNQGHTDRRFAYLQHSNSLVRNLFLFGSAEINLYKKVGGSTDMSPEVSNIYLMVRYRFSRKLSASASYSARDNVIWYETYKDIVERLLEQETLYGYRMQITYRPLKNITAGVRGSLRVRKTDPDASTNLYGYFTFNNLLVKSSSITVSAAWLETAYLSGNIYGVTWWHDLARGKASMSIGYRYIDYDFATSEITLTQHIPEIGFSWRIMRKLLLSINYEGTFDDESTFNRVYVNITQRF